MTDIIDKQLSELGFETKKEQVVSPAPSPVAKPKTGRVHEKHPDMFDMPDIPPFLDRRKPDERAKDWTPIPKPHQFKPERGDIKARLDELRLQFVTKSGQADAVIEKPALDEMVAEITTQVGDMLECCGLIYSSQFAPERMRELLTDFICTHTKHYNGKMYRYVCVVSEEK